MRHESREEDEILVVSPEAKHFPQGDRQGVVDWLRGS